MPAMSDDKFRKRKHDEDENPQKLVKCNKEEVRHGSYLQYYEYRSRDSRPKYFEIRLPECLKRLATPKDIHMLDIGCNSGKLTHDLLGKLQNACPDQQAHVLGVDIGHELVDKATAEHGSEHLEFRHVDISEASSRHHIERYMARKGIQRFDFICCFSILMYIHLNHGDEGLRQVLDYVCSLSELLVLELQSWKKYRDHARRMRRENGTEYEHYSKLTWKGSNGHVEQQISDYVISKGFSVICNSDEKNEFNRDVVIYARNKSE